LTGRMIEPIEARRHLLLSHRQNHSVLEGSCRLFGRLVPMPTAVPGSTRVLRLTAAAAVTPTVMETAMGMGMGMETGAGTEMTLAKGAVAHPAPIALGSRICMAALNTPPQLLLIAADQMHSDLTEAQDSQAVPVPVLVPVQLQLPRQINIAPIEWIRGDLMGINKGEDIMIMKTRQIVKMGHMGFSSVVGRIGNMVVVTLCLGLYGVE
jgi:hypothetical protein